MRRIQAAAPQNAPARKEKEKQRGKKGKKRSQPGRLPASHILQGREALSADTGACGVAVVDGSADDGGVHEARDVVGVAAGREHAPLVRVRVGEVGDAFGLNLGG